MEGSIIFLDFQKSILLSSRKWPFTIVLYNSTSSLRSPDKAAVCSRSVCSIIENGPFIIADKTATLESLIIFVTLLNISLLILIERPKQTSRDNYLWRHDGKAHPPRDPYRRDPGGHHPPRMERVRGCVFTSDAQISPFAFIAST